jgi:hypothetical protein
MATLYIRDFPEDLHQRARVRASQENVSLREVFTRALQCYLEGESYPVSVDFEGETYSGTYTLNSGLVTVYSAYGWLATQAGAAGPVTARILLREIVEGAKKRGKLRKEG